MSKPATETARTAPQIRSGSSPSPSPSRPRKPCGLSPCAPQRMRPVARPRASGGSRSAWRPTEGRVRTNRWRAAKRRQPPTDQRSRQARARSRWRAVRRRPAGRVERPGDWHAASRRADRAAGRGGRQSRRAAGMRGSGSPRPLQVFLRRSCRCFIGRSPGASRLRSPGWTHVGRGPRHALELLPITHSARAEHGCSAPGRSIPHRAARMRPKSTPLAAGGRDYL